jgi:predicted ATP-binding protein involved in virulence
LARTSVDLRLTCNGFLQQATQHADLIYPVRVARLLTVDVRGLLGRYDHSIPFTPQGNFVILYGPNGVGKTKLLELVAACVSVDASKIAQVPFDAAQLNFDSQESLTVWRDQDGEIATVRIVLRDRTGRTSEWTSRYDARDRGRRLRERVLPLSWQQIGPDLWEDTSDGEVVHERELAQRFNIPDSAPSQNSGDRAGPELVEFRERLRVHSIDTERLMTVGKSRRDGRISGALRTRPTVAEYAEDLRARLGQALAANSRTTQQLDRTFPQRLLQQRALQVPTESIRQKYNQQNKIRARLAEFSVISSQPDLPLPDRELEDWERSVLWTYLIDTDQKLSTFDDLLQRVSLFTEILNSKLLHKRVEVGSEQGFVIISTIDELRVPLQALSSGEQHELILYYDLLFNVPDATLVLIDEPEISLHIVWQQRFLSDIERIARLTSSQFMIATHSPQIIHKWWGNTVELSPDVTTQNP